MSEDGQARDLTQVIQFPTECGVLRPRSLADEVIAIELELDGYSSEELEYLPTSAITSESEEWMDRKEFDQVLSATIPLANRNALVSQIVASLDRHPHLLLTGPAGSGKTALLDRLLPRDKAGRRKPSRIVRLDCAGLRMPSIAQFLKSAAWSLFGTNEDAFRRFMTAWCLRPYEDPVLALLRARLRNGGLFIIDHVEHMSRSDELDSWFSDKLVPTASESGFGVIFCDRSAEAFGRFRKLRSMHRLPEIRIGNLTESDLSNWLQSPFFRERDTSISGADVFAVTGGAPRIIRDLSNWLRPESCIDQSALDRFLKHRPKHYVAHCERFIATLRSTPSSLRDGLQAFSNDRAPSNDPKQRVERAGWEKVRSQLLATGVVEDLNGELNFVSPVHQRRIENLTSSGALGLSLLRANDVSNIHYQSEWASLNQMAELAVDPISHFLYSERSPRVALRRLQAILDLWSFKTKLYLRDRDNARLFLELSPRHDDHVFPLSEPELVRAVQTGRSIVTEADSEHPNELIIPVVGYSGAVELVVRGKFCKATASRFQVDIARDKFVTLLRGLRPMLSQVLNRFWSEYERQERGHRLYRMNERSELNEHDPQSILSPFDPQAIAREMRKMLPQSAPAAIAVLRRIRGRWNVSSFDRFGPSEHAVFDSSAWAEPAEVERLDRIVTHPSKRGLVLSNKDAVALFPLLADQPKAVAFLRPVWFRARREYLIVVYLFQRAPGRGLDGALQQRLFNAAPAIALAS
jgi:hypothetical protein